MKYFIIILLEYNICKRNINIILIQHIMSRHIQLPLLIVIIISISISLQLAAESLLQNEVDRTICRLYNRL